MEFNPEKCQLLRVTRRREPLQCTYTIHGHPLEEVASAKYLSVELTNNLSWNAHVDKTHKKCMKSLGFLRRNLGNCPQAIKSTCYKTFVRPIAEYASCVWDAHTKSGISKIESIQRRAARYVSNDYSRLSSVSAMLDTLGWVSLQQRRAVAKVTMFYRILNGLVDIPIHDLIPVTTGARGSDERYLVPFARTASLKGSFFPDTIRLWNSLPQEVVASSSLSTFKAKVGNVTLR